MTIIEEHEKAIKEANDLLEKLNQMGELPATAHNPDYIQYTAGEPLKPAQELFVRELVAHGNRRIAYQKAYPGVADTSAYSAACRLLKDPVIAAYLTQLQLEIKKAAQEVVIEHYKGRIADIEEKRAVLAQIIRGELVTEKEITKKGETQTVRYKSEPKDRMKAILIDSRLEQELLKELQAPDRGIRLLQ